MMRLRKIKGKQRSKIKGTAKSMRGQKSGTALAGPAAPAATARNTQNTLYHTHEIIH